MLNGKYISFIDADDYVEKDYIEVLYNKLKKDKTDMAISSHKVIYSTGTVLEKATGEESILEPKETLKRILYDDKIDLSAWAKLYKADLFKEVRFPKGRIFEDAATTYKLIDKSAKISIISKSTYNYIIREESISNKQFTPSKMDLIVSTKEMTDFVKGKYPDLEKAADRRLMYAYLSTLSQLAASEEKFPKEQRELMSYIKRNGNNILRDKNIPKRDKFGILCTKLGFGFYKSIWNLYRKKTGRK